MGLPFDPADPWSWNAFSPPTDPRVPPPSGRPLRGRPVPEQDELFKIQRLAYDLLGIMRELQHHDRHNHDLNAAYDKTESLYRKIQKYLQEHAQV